MSTDLHERTCSSKSITATPDIALHSMALAHREPSASKEPSAHKEPSASKEPSANQEPSAHQKRSAHQKPSAKSIPAPQPLTKPKSKAKAKVAASGKKAKVGRPKGQSRQARIAAILQASRKLFAEKGFAQTTFKDVGKVVGMTHAALYSYYSSKAELYLATIADSEQLLKPHYKKAIEQGGTLQHQLRKVLMATVDVHEKDSSITTLLSTMAVDAGRHEELAELVKQSHSSIFDVLLPIFEEAQTSGEIRSRAKPQQLIETVMVGALGVIRSHALLPMFDQGGSDSLHENMEVYVDLIEARLFNQFALLPSQELEDKLISRKAAEAMSRFPLSDYV